MFKEGFFLLYLYFCICKCQITTQTRNNNDFDLKNIQGMRPFSQFRRYGVNPGERDTGSEEADFKINQQIQPYLRNTMVMANEARNSKDERWNVFPYNRGPPAMSDVELQDARVVVDKKCFPNTEGKGKRCLRKIRRNKISGKLDANHDVNYSEVKDKILSTEVTNINDFYSSEMENDEVMETSKLHEINSHTLDETERTIGSNPCVCYWTEKKCGCDCRGSLNYDNFQEIATNFYPCNNFTFTLVGGDHYALPPNFFSKIQNVEEFNLFISNATFEYICDPTPMTSPFKGVLFANSALVRLSNVRVRRGWNWKPFEQLQSSSDAQVNVILENCELRRLTSDFSSLAGGHVDTVDISSSNLEMVGSHAFGTFENMTRFKVPNNKIQQLRRTDFPGMLSNLEEIDIRNNELQYLDDDIFTNMPSMKEVLLSGNPLTVLSEKTFQGILRQANIVGISDIPLTCDCRLKWVKDSMSRDDAAKRNMKGAICRRPSYLRGIPLDYLSKEHLLCF